MSYEYNKQDVYDFAAVIQTEKHEKGNELFFSQCPYCHGGKHGDKDTFSINLENGTFNCFRSGCKRNTVILWSWQGISVLNWILGKPKNISSYRRRKLKPDLRQSHIWNPEGLAKRCAEGIASQPQGTTRTCWFFPSMTKTISCSL